MDIEESIVKTINKNVSEEKRSLRLFHVCTIIFLVAEVLLIVSTLNLATIINGIPRWFEYFKFVAYIGYLVFVFATFFLRRLNKSFFYSFLSMVIYILLTFVSRICSTSSNSLYVMLGKGLSWSAGAVFCIFFLYYFHGSAMVFKSFGYEQGRKVFLTFLISFVVLFLLSKGFEYFSTASFIRVTTSQRFFLYGSWISIFLLYALSFVAVLMGTRYLNKKVKEENIYEGKDETNPA